MSKTCARCGKTVYPIEELKCLDKIWHKQCFKCQVCQMTLNMRNYKGFDKEPYCEAHIPKAKATTVAETPEYRRIAENTKIQSNAKYHAEFEKAKGKFTQVADDPETLRIKENSKNISNVAYHGELQKKADMERQRNIGDKGEYVRPAEASNGSYQQQPARTAPPPHYSPPQNESAVGQSRMSSNVIYTSDRGAVTSSERRVGSIHDLDPVNDYYGSLTSADSYGQNYVPPPSAHHHQQPTHHQHIPPQHQQQQQRQQPYYGQEVQQNKYPSAGYNDPMAGRREGQGYNGSSSAARVPSGYQQPFPEPYNDPPAPAPEQARNHGRIFRALYEYKAQDADEVSFIEGDFIVNCTAIDEGWLNGIVHRTGKRGMLPANYVTPAI